MSEGKIDDHTNNELIERGKRKPIFHYEEEAEVRNLFVTVTISLEGHRGDSRDRLRVSDHLAVPLNFAHFAPDQKSLARDEFVSKALDEAMKFYYIKK